MSKQVERVLWSVAIPGLGQLLNGEFYKGVLFIVLEFLINMNSHLNDVIMLSFQGKIREAVAMTNYQWLMFYPCVYMYAMWDAYKGVGGGEDRLACLPFVVPAYLGTVGVVYSKWWLGPVWLGIVFAVTGAVLGLLLKNLLAHDR